MARKCLLARASLLLLSLLASSALDVEAAAFAVVAPTISVSTTSRNLFFARKGEAIRLQQQPESVLPGQSSVARDLQSATLSLPYTFQSGAGGGETLTLRHLEREDLDEVVPMCVKEFGTPPRGFPWNNLNKQAIDLWLESIIFGPLVRMSLSLKVQRRKQGYDETLPQLLPDDNMLCLDNGSVIVGFVDLSVQPLDPRRNPPPFPLPYIYKRAYSISRKVPPPNGWVSNLLVDDTMRGRGYSKALMLGVEGLARQWGCTSISLHVDSDSVTGRIPRRLYERLGYQPVIDTSTDTSWMGPDMVKSGLYMVDDVPLLFLRKELSEAP